MMRRTRSRLVVSSSAERIGKVFPNLGLPSAQGVTCFKLVLALAWLAVAIAQQSCTVHDDCAFDLTRFCNNIPFGRTNGVCEDCWKCCLLPGQFNVTATVKGSGDVVAGGCSLRCGCNVGSGCTSNADCAPGLFCRLGGLVTNVCAPCTACASDSDAADPRGCSSACPLGAVDLALGPPPDPPTAHDAALVEAAVFLSFALEPWRGGELEDRATASPDLLIRFLSNQTHLHRALNSSMSYDRSYVREALLSLYEAAGAPLDEPLTLGAVAAALFNGSRSLVCPKFSAAQPASSLARVTGPGCPCNLTANAAVLRCPSGHACSQRAYVGLSTDILFDPAAAQLQGLCVPCSEGQTCGEGVVVTPANGVTRRTRDLDCPAGSYCPTAGEVYSCPAGYYCGYRALNRTSCNYTELLSDMDALSPLDGELDLITRLKRNREPIRGNYCPSGSTKPSQACNAGNYCPNASVQIVCPRGHYCKQQSIYPVKCPVLVRCPEGTAAPDGRPLAGLIFGIMFAVTWVLYAVTQIVWRRIDTWLYDKLRRERKARKSKMASTDGSTRGAPTASASGATTPAANGRRELSTVTTGASAASSAPTAAAEKGKEHWWAPFWSALKSDIEWLLKREVQRNDEDQPTRVEPEALRDLLQKPHWSIPTRINIRFENMQGRTSKAKDADGPALGVTGVFEAGHFSAIMGPSGCGKTTLIRMLSGRMPESNVSAYSANQPVSLTQTTYRCKLGYVPQDDCLHTDLTVRENIAYAARLKLPPGIKQADRHAIVEDTLQLLGIEADSRKLVGTPDRKIISGGQRKRVSIGVEIVGKPLVLFMDEPTSGLDATMSSELCFMLRTLARESYINIIAVIHQPRYSSFEKFNKVLLLTTEKDRMLGRPAYLGPPKLCVEYFTKLGFTYSGNDNVADWVLDIISLDAKASGQAVSVKDMPDAWRICGETWLENQIRTFLGPVKRMARVVQKIRWMLANERLEEKRRQLAHSSSKGVRAIFAAFRTRAEERLTPSSRQAVAAGSGRLHSGALRTTKSVEASLPVPNNQERQRDLQRSITAPHGGSIRISVVPQPRVETPGEGDTRLGGVPGSSPPPPGQQNTSSPEVLGLGSSTADAGQHVSPGAPGYALSISPFAGGLSLESLDSGAPSPEVLAVSLKRQEGQDRAPEVPACTIPSNDIEAISELSDRARAAAPKPVPHLVMSAVAEESKGGAEMESAANVDSTTPITECATPCSGQPSPAKAEAQLTPEERRRSLKEQLAEIFGAEHVAGEQHTPAAGDTRPATQKTSGLTAAEEHPYGKVVLQYPFEAYNGVKKAAASGSGAEDTNEGTLTPLKRLWWFFRQLIWLMGRNLQKSLRAFLPDHVVDVLLLLSAAFIVGMVQGSKWGLTSVPSNIAMVYLVLSMLATVTHLRTFTDNKLVQKHERSAGISVGATFLASNLTDCIWIFVSPAIYFSVYYYVALPRAPFSVYYNLGNLVCWWSSGLSYMISLSRLSPKNQPITAVVITLTLGALLNGIAPTIRSGRGNLLKVVLGVSYNRWAMEAGTIQELMNYYDYKSNEIIATYYTLGICKMDQTLIDDGDDQLSYEEAMSYIRVQQSFNANGCHGYYAQANIILFCMGLGLRILAFLQIYQWNTLLMSLKFILDPIKKSFQQGRKRAKRAWGVVPKCCGVRREPTGPLSPEQGASTGAVAVAVVSATR